MNFSSHVQIWPECPLMLVGIVLGCSELGKSSVMLHIPLLDGLACGYFVLKLYWSPLLILPEELMTMQPLKD